MVRISIDEILSSLPVLEPETRSGCGSCGSGDAESRCGNGLEKIYPTTAVRFGYMKHIGEFSYGANMRFTCGARVVVQTSRGLEIGEQVSLTCNGCSKSVTREHMKSYADASGENTFIFDAGRLIREANRADLAEYARLQSVVPEYRDLCRSLARRHRLGIKVVECELLFGGERAIFYFSAEGRVDFRDLVRDLSTELQTRIQMVQVGARDEARLLADFETCGRECCCKVFLKTLKPVTMKMAKMQKQTIDPSKVSGRCGRLKCCLRYEHESYEELARKLPRIGARIRTAHGDGVVVNRQILTQLVQIETMDDRLVTVVVEDILPGAPPRVEDALPRPGGGDPPPSPQGRAPRQMDRTAPPRRTPQVGPPAAMPQPAPGDSDAERPPNEGASAPPPAGAGPQASRREPREEGRGERTRRPSRRRIVGRRVEAAPPGDAPPPEASSQTQGPENLGDAAPNENPQQRDARRFRRRRRGGEGPPGAGGAPQDAPPTPPSP